MDDTIDPMLVDAYETLGITEGASEEAVTFAVIKSIHGAARDPKINDLEVRIMNILLAEDTIKCFELEKKHPGALENMGYDPETRTTHFINIARDTGTAIYNQNGREMLDDMSIMIAQYNKLEATEPLPPSMIERFLRKAGITIPEPWGQILSRRADRHAGSRQQSNLLDREKLFEQIVRSFTTLKTMASGSEAKLTQEL